MDLTTVAASATARRLPLRYTTKFSDVNTGSLYIASDLVDVVSENCSFCLNQVMDLSIANKKKKLYKNLLRQTTALRLTNSQRNKAERAYLANESSENKIKQIKLQNNFKEILSFRSNILRQK